jgi:hypothetical protein
MKYAVCLVFILFFCFHSSIGQNFITVKGLKVNAIDKKKRKQGEWLFFDRAGDLRISCTYRDNEIISPVLFYENNDTAFIRFPLKDDTEDFIFYENNKAYTGSIIHTSDSTSAIELDPDSTLNNQIISKIKKYKSLILDPLYHFGKQRMIDYIAAAFTGSNFTFNKPLHILVTISSSGFVTEVEFPADKNNLSGDEQRELYIIYSNMPRWQPFFVNNKAVSVKVMLSNNSTLTVDSY